MRSGLVSVVLVLLFVAVPFGQMFSEELEPLENPEFAPSAPFDILMYGNSYTSANNLASLVQDGMVSGGVTTTVDSLTGGGMTLDGHSQNAQSSGNSWNTTLNDGTAWDYVVLQDQSQIPGLYRNTAYWQDSLAGAQVLDGFAEDVGAESILMMTWGRRNGDTNNQVLYPDFLSMQERLEDGYLDYRDNLSTPNRDVWIAPVGLAFKHIYENVQASGVTPENSGNLFYDLYSADGSHPSLSGSYLASCVLYATITGNSPVGLSDSTSLSASIKLDLQEAAAATVFNETNHLTYSWQITSQNNSGLTYSTIPNLQNQTRYSNTFSMGLTDGQTEHPSQHLIEYDDGKFISVFTRALILGNGLVESPSVSLWSVPEFGSASTIYGLELLNEDLEIPLSTNFSNFDTCKSHVYDVGIYIYCMGYMIPGGIGSDLLEFGNNNSISIENEQDVFIHWDLSGSYQNAWIPQVSQSSNQWTSNLRGIVSADYIYKVNFLNDSIFLMMEGASTHPTTFPNGTLNCPVSITGYCSFIVEVNSNGSVIDYISSSANRPSLNPSWHVCNNMDRFEIVNKSAININPTSAGETCTFWDSNGNIITSNSWGNSYAGTFMGFDLDFNFIRSFDTNICAGTAGNMMIQSMQILIERTNYVVYGSCDSGQGMGWHDDNCAGTCSTWSTVGSIFPNGSRDWTYSWYSSGGAFDTYSILSTSYGMVWAGPSSYSGLDWDGEANGRLGPYPGISSGSGSGMQGAVFLFDGTWVDMYQGGYCALGGQYQSRPIMFNELSHGFSCAFVYGTDWRVMSYSIDLDIDGVGHSLDVFPFEGTQQTDTDLDGFGDNIFGNNADACPTEQGNSTLDRLGCLDTDGDGQSNLNDFYPTDATQTSDTDFDGYGDNLTGTRGDSCPYIYGESNRNNTFGCSDLDYDGWADTQDSFPSESSQWEDSDFDGYGDEYNGFEGDTCPDTYGLSYKDTFGCVDSDLDGWSDIGDDLPFEITQWLDGDGDGYGNNESEGANLVDLFPNDATQWNDTDGDGYGDNRFGSEGDKFPSDPTRWADVDDDGYADEEDEYPTDLTQWNDTDRDGFGDEEVGNNGDNCPLIYGNSTIDRRGCIDSDGDGWSDEGDDFPDNPNEYLDTDGDTVPDHLDMFPFDPTQKQDTDGDGYGDNADGNLGDAFPNDPTRHADSDRDSYDDDNDAFPFDSTQWSDADGDGYGDNPLGLRPDTFPLEPSQWSDVDGDGWGDNETGYRADAYPTDITQWSDLDGDGYGDNQFGINPDAYPKDPTQWADYDQDGLGDNPNGTNPDPFVNDTDNDGYNNSIDPLPNIATPGDLDGDLCLDEMDLFPSNPNECKDSDGDGWGDNQDSDDDNDGINDITEAQEGTDPMDASSVPVESFEVRVPGTVIGLGAWDLMGIFGGVPFFSWLAFCLVTRGGRSRRFEKLLFESKSEEELSEISRRYEFALMLRLLGPHQALRLERVRSNLEVHFNEMERKIVEDPDFDLPNEEHVMPPSIDIQGIIHTDGYEWTDHMGFKWYRVPNIDSDWSRWQ